jgi:carboxymethylenebutenolidase
MKLHLPILFLLLSLLFWGCRGGNENNNNDNTADKSNTPASNSDSATGMKVFNGNEQFKKAHPAPEGDSSNMEGRTVHFDAEGKQANAYLVPAKMGISKKYLLVFHEWWGLNNQIKRAADRYAADLRDVNVLAVDLYDGKVTRSPDTAQKFVEETPDSRIESIIRGAMHYIGNDARYATLGWCFGGGWALQTGIIHPENNIGIVIYYGMPETNESQLKKIKAPVQGFFGTQDKFITPAIVKTFAGKMKKLNKPFDYKEYNAVHAFANPSNPKYNRKATADARIITQEFLNKIFAK